MGGGVRSKDYVCKDAVQGLGRGWAAVCGAAGLGCFAVMAQYDAKGLILCRGGGALGNSRMHAEGLNRVGRIVYGCVYLCTQSALGRTGFRRHRRRDRLAVDVGDQDSRGHRRARVKYLKTENVWGVEEFNTIAANKGSLRLQHFIIIGHCNCLLLGCLWAQHLCYL